VEMYDDDGRTHDSKDPNYNSEDEEVGGTRLCERCQCSDTI